MNYMLSSHVHTLGRIEFTQFCQYTGDKLIMILHAIQLAEVNILVQSFETSDDRVRFVGSPHRKLF